MAGWVDAFKVIHRTRNGPSGTLLLFPQAGIHQEQLMLSLLVHLDVLSELKK